MPQPDRSGDGARQGRYRSSNRGHDRRRSSPVPPPRHPAGDAGAVMLRVIPAGGCAEGAQAADAGASETQKSAGVGFHVDRQPSDLGRRGRGPSTEVRPEDQPLRIRRLDEQISALVGMDVDVEPQAVVALVEISEVDRSRACCDPGADSAEQERHRAPAVAEADVQLGMAAEHTPEEERRRRDRLLEGVADRDVAQPASQAGVSVRSIDAGDDRVYEQRHVEVRAGGVEVVEIRVIEVLSGVSADDRADHVQVPEGPLKLRNRCSDVADGQQGECLQSGGICTRPLGEELVVLAREAAGYLGGRMGEVPQRGRTEYPPLDAGLVQLVEPLLGSAVQSRDPPQHVVEPSGGERRDSGRVPVEKRAEVAGTSEKCLEEQVGVRVDSRHHEWSGSTGWTVGFMPRCEYSWPQTSPTQPSALSKY